MPETIKVEAGIPIPPRGRQKPDGPIYPFETMEIGDSFFVEATTYQQRSRLSCAALNVKKRTGRNFTVRKVAGGTRIWRTA